MSGGVAPSRNADGRRNAPWMWVVLCVGITAASLWLRNGFPVHALPDAGFDDGLFVRLAYALAGGEWLGPYDRVTLAKGMFYPLFIALSSALGLPLKMAEQLVYLGVAAALSLLVARCTRPGLGLLTYAALAFNPMLWHPSLARVAREGLYLSLALALLGLFAVVLTRRRQRPGSAWLLGGATGLVLGAFWMTREEGPWILPALAGMVLCALAWRAHRQRRMRARHPRLTPGLAASLAPLALRLAAVTVGALVVVTGVKGMNYARYGAFVSTEFHAGPFVRAYGALARIRHDRWQPYVVFPADARQRAYAASPAARELQPHLEGANGAAWREAGCTQLAIADCPEILSGWFMWALRDAVWRAGHYDSAPRALAFYARLADEIDAACDTGQIACGPARRTLAPPFRWERLAPTMDAGATLLGMMLRLGDGQIGVDASKGRLENIETFGNLVGPVARPGVQRYELAGHLAGAAPGEVLQVVDAKGRPSHAIVELEPAASASAAGRRFRILTECPPASCHLRSGHVLLQSLQPGAKVEQDGIVLSLERARDLRRTFHERRMALQQGLARAIAAGYAAVWPPLSVLALGGWIAALGSGLLLRRSTWPLVLLGVGSLLAVATRIALLAYLDATSIPSVNVLYASPASPMMILFTVLGLAVGAAWARSRWGRLLRRPAAAQPRAA